MKDEYDFSNGVRGRFYRAGAELRLPVYLEQEVQTYLAKHAAQRGIELSELVDALLRRDIELIETGK
jgi:hypothetical protein